MRLYLSSTLSDLEEERRAVKEVLSGQYTVVESYEADPRPLWQSCVADVATCTIYIGIVGLRYGFVPPGQDKSITELEFDAALAAGLPCFVFVREVDAIPASRTDLYTKQNDPALIEAFRARLSSGASGIPRAALFTTADDLKVKVLRALQRQPAPALDRPVGLPSPPAAAKPAAPETAPPPPSPSPPLTELQKLLKSYLQDNWAALHGHPAFLRANLFPDLDQAVPLSAERVFAMACDGPPIELLLGAREFFQARAARGVSPASSVSESDGIVCSAIVRCALVAAERYVRGKVDGGAHRDHDPVWSSDHLVACIEAAVRLGFGLCFSPGSPQPENVFRLVHPVPEPGVAGEEGAALSAAELLATIERREFQTGQDYDPDYLRAFIRRRASGLGTALVVSTDAAGRFESAERRAELLKDLREQFDLRTFFQRRGEDAMPPWARQMQDSLLHALGPVLDISLHKAAITEKDMAQRESERAAAPAVTNLTMTFNAPVGTLAQANAPGAQAAARDIVNGLQGAELLQVLAAVQRAIDACAAQPGDAAQRRLMEQELDEVRTVLQGEGRSASDAKLVKRCLDGVETSARALSNGRAIVETLAPVWAGLKQSWPAFLALFN
ncbi:DUF4062 domain-containing protein [Accumulibacter sp.]|uniref:DUF4062 domain-containing protein n=1 Tax=Accumulibacter sp. TaxID=2053492 RepID=UPI0025F35714|nr:DUF4062 domain-containing protein [Accumulibacter sp.]MCM8611922.1 DUF4062 domain-containing protein [Accumulibacter sp.]MCM8635544.1 DUF4062 domain-containing protein [Accumulibacter sp.]MCM8639122.1 DUF4062 domain-containing protein [Accumulibacter sp.]